MALRLVEPWPVGLCLVELWSFDVDVSDVPADAAELAFVDVAFEPSRLTLSCRSLSERWLADARCAFDAFDDPVCLAVPEDPPLDVPVVRLVDPRD